MPYVRVASADLVVGQEYILTHVGCSPKTGSNGATFEEQVGPIYPGSSTMVKHEVERCERVVYPPGSKGKLENAYKTWKRINFRDPTILETYGVHFNPAGPEMDYRKRAFYKGPHARGGHIFVQERTFGSKKTVAFDPSAEPGPYAFPLFFDGPRMTWAAWTEEGGAAAAAQEEGGAAAAAAEEGAAAAEEEALQMGNLLGMNNKPKMSNGNTAKARENWYKQHAREQELKGLFGGHGRTVRRRSGRKGTRRARRY
jgi:hypothetical protein